MSNFKKAGLFNVRKVIINHIKRMKNKSIIIIICRKIIWQYSKLNSNKKKTFHKLQWKGSIIIQLVKDIFKKPIVCLILNAEIFNIFLLGQGTRLKCPYYHFY